MEKNIEKYNDLLSEKYDAATTGEFNWTPPAKLEAMIGGRFKKGVSVLDIGCGTGQTAKTFIDRGALVTGIDISQKMLNAAAKKMKFERLIKYDIEDGLAKMFPNEKFDIINAIGILEFVPDIEKIIAEMKKLLKSGGLIAFSYEMFVPNDVYGTKKTALLSDGFKNVPDILNFTVYRRTQSDIDAILKKLALEAICRQEFTAYLKSSQKIPVSYELILAKTIS